MFDILYQNTLLRTTFCDFPHFKGRLYLVLYIFKDDFLLFYTFLNLSSG